MCPYKGCGRKFVSDSMLKTHLERRHAAKETVVSTPVHVPAKVVDNMQSFFGAKPRPVTAGRT